MGCSSAGMEPVALARWAMATRFEILLYGDNPVALRAAGEEALHEIQRLEAQLNLYSKTSEVAALNARAAREPVRVEPGLFRLLEQCAAWHAATEGAFDITVAPLLRCWGFLGGTGQLPDPERLEHARQLTGMHWVELDPGAFTVRFLKVGVMIDLGAVGKGYAIDLAADCLRESGVTSALLHGGTSSAFAIGAPPDEEAWKIAIGFARPALEADSIGTTSPPRFRTILSTQPTGPLAAAAPDATPSQPLLAIAPLRDQALSVSAVWGKAFESDRRLLGHVLDPREGRPVRNALLAALILPSATEADALSTALLVGGASAQDRLFEARPDARTLVAGAEEDGEGAWVRSRGLTVREGPWRERIGPG